MQWSSPLFLDPTMPHFDRRHTWHPDPRRSSAATRPTRDWSPVIYGLMVLAAGAAVLLSSPGQGVLRNTLGAPASPAVTPATDPAYIASALELPTPGQPMASAAQPDVPPNQAQPSPALATPTPDRQARAPRVPPAPSTDATAAAPAPSLVAQAVNPAAALARAQPTATGLALATATDPSMQFRLTPEALWSPGPRLPGGLMHHQNDQVLALMLDLSGSSVDTLPFLLGELRRTIQTLSDDHRLVLVLAREDGPVFYPAQGTLQASLAGRRAATRWLDASQPRLFPQGRTALTQALNQTLHRNPDHVVILCDDLQGPDSARAQARAIRIRLAYAPEPPRLSVLQVMHGQAPAARTDPSLAELTRDYRGEHRVLLDRPEQPAWPRISLGHGW